MKILDFFRIFKRKIASKTKRNAYLPLSWDDDYCQIEIVPAENRESIENRITEVKILAEQSREGLGFTEIFEVGQMSITTFSKEILTEPLSQLLTNYKFEKAKSINYVGYKIANCETTSTKAFGFSNFTIFFDTEEEFVKHIWLSINATASRTEISREQFKLIKDALYSLGEEYEMVLADWNSLQLIDLSNKNQIDKYLNGYWK